MASINARAVVIGFIHVRKTGPEAFRAGYLLTTDYGRPIEFHYTSQLIVPTLQQKLYGTEFEPLLFAEILAKPMTDRQGTAPQLIAVNQAPLLRLRAHIPAPVILLTPNPTAAADPQVETAPQFAKDSAAFEKLRSLVPPGFLWHEPFERIDAALAEIKDPTLGLVAA